MKIITSLLFIILEILVSYCVFRFYNLFPPAWFRDYDSEKDTGGQDRDTGNDTDGQDRDTGNDAGGNHRDTGKPLHPSPRMKSFPDAVWFCSLLVFVIFLFFTQYGFTFLFFCNIFTILVFSYIFVADLKTRIIPDQFIFGLLLVSFFWMINDLTLLNDTGEKWYWLILMRITGGLAGGVILWLVAWIGTRLLKHEAMGMGDVKLIASCGIIVGYPGVFFVLVLSFLLAFFPAVFNMVKGLRRGISSYESVPFGPFIVLAATIYLLFPAEFAMLYFWYSHLSF